MVTLQISILRLYLGDSFGLLWKCSKPLYRDITSSGSGHLGLSNIAPVGVATNLQVHNYMHEASVGFCIAL